MSDKREEGLVTEGGSLRTVPLTAVVVHEAPWYVARCLEVEAVSQGETIEKALANLRDVLEVYLEEEPRPTLALQEHPVVATLDVPISA